MPSDGLCPLSKVASCMLPDNVGTWLLSLPLSLPPIASIADSVIVSCILTAPSTVKVCLAKVAVACRSCFDNCLSRPNNRWSVG